jgi:hypothetical protein
MFYKSSVGILEILNEKIIVLHNYNIVIYLLI